MAAESPAVPPESDEFILPHAVPDFPRRAIQGTGGWVYVGRQPRTSCGLHRHDSHVQFLVSDNNAEYLATWRHGRELKQRLVGGGQVWAVPAGCEHAIEWLRPAIVVVMYSRLAWVHAVGGHDLRHVSLEPRQAYVSREPLIGELFAKLCRYARQPKPAADGLVSTAGRALAGQLIEAHFAPRQLRSHEDRLPLATRNLILRHIDNHLDEELTLDGLAALAGLAPNYFGQVFRASVGLPPMTYVLDQRVIRARELLREGRHSIAEVAVMTGFSDQPAMTKHFRRLLDTTPGDYHRRSLAR